MGWCPSVPRPWTVNEAPSGRWAGPRQEGGHAKASYSQTHSQQHQQRPAWPSPGHRGRAADPEARPCSWNHPPHTSHRLKATPGRRPGPNSRDPETAPWVEGRQGPCDSRATWTRRAILVGLAGSQRRAAPPGCTPGTGLLSLPKPCARRAAAAAASPRSRRGRRSETQLLPCAAGAPRRAASSASAFRSVRRDTPHGEHKTLCAGRPTRPAAGSPRLPSLSAVTTHIPAVVRRRI